jgi:hypothetical protein
MLAAEAGQNPEHTGPCEWCGRPHEAYPVVAAGHEK